METESLEEMVAQNASEQLVASLKPASDVLNMLNRNFPFVCQDIQLVSCYELHDTPTAKVKCRP